MEAATSTMQHPSGLGPRGPNLPHGAQQAQGPCGTMRPEEQHQQRHKPFFYIQPSQSYLPMQSLQWPVALPVPMSYNPYYGYPGLGYGMPVMPHYQPNPYMEPPGFVVPHTHLHLMDYRRMLNPQYYQTMAYHSRRFRYQHSTPAREMTSSEVQTEPLLATQKAGNQCADTDASSGLAVCSSNTTGVPTSQPISPVLAVPKGDLDIEDTVPSSSTRKPPNGSFVIQTEEVRIECCTMPVGLQLLHSHDAAEVSHGFSQDVVQCGSILQDGVLQDEELCLPTDQSEQSRQACPDILLVGTPSTTEKMSVTGTSRNQKDPVSVTSEMGSLQALGQGDSEDMSEKDLSTTRSAKNIHFKVVHMPFDPKYLDALRKMESPDWLMDTLPSPESEINVSTEAHDETLDGVPEGTLLDALREEAPVKEVIPLIPLVEDEMEMTPTVDEMVSEEHATPLEESVAKEAPEPELMDTAEVRSNSILLANSRLKADNGQQRPDLNLQDHQDTSFESLPAYLPSTSWLADFDNIYYSNKVPPTPVKQTNLLRSRELDVPSRRRKLNLDCEEHPTVRKSRQRYKPKGKVDRQTLSDHECGLRNFNENKLTTCGYKSERLCTRCLGKRRMHISATPGPDVQPSRKAVPFQQWNNALLPTCESCQSHLKQRLTSKGSSSDVNVPSHKHDTEGESSENGSCRRGPKWRALDDLGECTNFKKPLTRKHNLTCSAAPYQKLREKNCVCNEAQHQPVACERLRQCPHGNTIREMDENCAMSASRGKWRNLDQVYPANRWQTDRSWKAAVPTPDIDNSKNDARSQLTKHNKSQSQGMHRNDTRC